MLGTRAANLNESFYSSSYQEAKSRFVASSIAIGAKLTSYPLSIENDPSDKLSIDVAVVGPDDAPALVVSSGLHGVEGFLGSAIQLAMLDQIKADIVTDVRWVFIHAINPFGFSRIRRFNGDNVDLNRNFLPTDSRYTGAPEGYSQLDALLNPATEPSRFEPFRVKAMWSIFRFGLATLRQCIAAGQYEYPQGIFYGGSGPSPAMNVFEENCAHWIGAARKIIHVDVHSGLGAFGRYKLLVDELAGSKQGRWYERVFGSASIKTKDDAAYLATGTLGRWIQDRFADRDYRFVTAEFGTYGPVRVLAAIRAENRAHHFAEKQSRAFQDAKTELMECFCPADESWRQTAVTAGLKIIEQSVASLNAPTLNMTWSGNPKA